MLIDEEWYEKNKDKISEAEIDALGIEVSHDGKKCPQINQSDGRGKVKSLMNLLEGSGAAG